MSNLHVDAHVHLQDRSFSDILGKLTAEAEAAGVKRLFCNAVVESDWHDIIRLTREMPQVVPFIGIHPWFCLEARTGWQNRLADALDTLDDQPVGIGETGLDKVKPVDFEMQRKSFRAHLEVAAGCRLPVSIHCIKAWGPLLEILAEVTAERTVPKLMIHSFNGSIETMKRLVDFGCFISYSCAVADPTRKKLRDVFLQTPITSMMLETDAPFQKNPHLKNVRYLTAEYNEPVAVSALYRYTAELLDMDLDRFSSQLWKNAAIFTNQTIDR